MRISVALTPKLLHEPRLHVVALGGAVAVIHGGRINSTGIVLAIVAVLALLIAALGFAVLAGRTTSTTTPLSGGAGRVVSRIHRFLCLIKVVLLRPVLQAFSGLMFTQPPQHAAHHAQSSTLSPFWCGLKPVLIA